MSSQARVRKDREVQMMLVFQGKLTPVCEFPFLCFAVEQSFLLQSKRTCVPSGTEQAPRDASARA